MLMSDRHSPSPRRSPRCLIRRADQAVAAALVVVGLVSTVGWWVSQGGVGGRLIELETAEPQTTAFEVDVNGAAWPELAQLPSIGPTLARRIVESRETDGPFFEHDDLRRVKGIGPKTLDEIRPFLQPMPEGGMLVGQ